MTLGLIERSLIWLFALTVWSGALAPFAVGDALHFHVAHEHAKTGFVSADAASADPIARKVSDVKHKCIGGTACMQSMDSVFAPTSWIVITSTRIQFSIAVKRLTDRSYGPEPTPPISRV